MKRKEADVQNRRLTLEDLDDKWDCTIPLVDTLVQKYHHTLAYDRGRHVHMDWKQYRLVNLSGFMVD